MSDEITLDDEEALDGEAGVQGLTYIPGEQHQWGATIGSNLDVKLTWFARVLRKGHGLGREHEGHDQGIQQELTGRRTHERTEPLVAMTESQCQGLG
jgi:hypothetical protein